MRWLPFVLWLFLSAAAWSQPVVVTSGEHEDFSRLVVTLPEPIDWKFGSTPDGYELRLGSGQIYDLSQAFAKIPRKRVSTIWADPETGALKIGIGCACHAIPFAYRPDVVVIDIREGPPPPGSSFETALDGSDDGAARSLAAAQGQMRPRTRPDTLAVAAGADDVPRAYDWLSTPVPAAVAPTREPPPTMLREVDPDILALRDAILRQVSRGAAQGVVDLVKPPLRRDPQDQPRGPSERAHVQIGGIAGLGTDALRTSPTGLTGDGDICIADDRLEIHAWADERPFALQMADAQSGLVGEFDASQEAEVTAAARFYLHIGYGAEARRILSVFGSTSPERPLLESLGLLVDGHPDADGPFDKMATCDTAAALWAVLAARDDRVLGQSNRPAVLRSFSALPLHLRRHLGPGLAERYLAQGDLATALSIRDAIARAATDSGHGASILDAQISLAEGDAAGAGRTLDGVVDEAGIATPAALVHLVDARIASGEAVDDATITAIAALLREHAGTDLEGALQRAIVLAKASGGDFDGAFAALSAAPATEAEVWDLLATKGADSALLAHAVRAPDAPPQSASAASRRQIAGRLHDLGFAAQALGWLGDGALASDEDRLLAARANLRLNDGTAALAMLDGMDGATASALRAEAFIAVARPEAAAQAYADAGDDTAAARAARWARDWPQVVDGPEEIWSATAGLAMPPLSEGEGGPIAKGQIRVNESASARSSLAALLKATPPVDPE